MMTLEKQQKTTSALENLAEVKETTACISSVFCQRLLCGPGKEISITSSQKDRFGVICGTIENR